jgi:hypothetical protein
MGYQYFLESPISTTHRLEEDRMTYLNKSEQVNHFDTRFFIFLESYAGLERTTRRDFLSKPADFFLAFRDFELYFS